MLNLTNNHRETRNPIWNTATVIAAAITASALIFAVTAATSLSNPQPDHIGTVMNILAEEQIKILHNTSRMLLTLSLAALPMLITSLLLLPSKSDGSAIEQG